MDTSRVFPADSAERQQNASMFPNVGIGDAPRRAP
jgi:hypothetical protein